MRENICLFVGGCADGRLYYVPDDRPMWRMVEAPQSPREVSHFQHTATMVEIDCPVSDYRRCSLTLGTSGAGVFVVFGMTDKEALERIGNAYADSKRLRV